MGTRGGDLRSAFAGASSVLLVTPPDPRQVWWQRNVIDAAAAAGVPWIVKISAFAARRDSPTNMGRWHYDGELALRDSGLAHAVVRPQYFMDNLLQAAPSVRAHGVLRSHVPPDHPIAMVDVRDVAAVCFALLVAPRPVASPVLPTGPEPLLMEQVARRLGRTAGREVRYEFVEHDRFRAMSTETGMARWRLDDVLAITSDCGPEVTADVPELVGRAPLSLEDFARRHEAELFGRPPLLDPVAEPG